jgi:CubicO group peptidase (beta-lactamase class C family)
VPSPEKTASTLQEVRMKVRVVRAVLSVVFVSAFLAGSLCAVALPRATPEEVGFSSQRLAQLKSVLQGYVDAGRLPGSVTLVARRGKVVFLEGLGQRDRESKSAMRPDSIFRIASQTKALVSVGIMMLQEQGKLLISDPLYKYIPEFRETKVAVRKEGGGYDVVKAKRPITIRDLLTHTSGIGYGTGTAAEEWKKAGIQNWYFADRNEPVGAVVTRMAALPADAQPGEAWVYGYSVDILGVVIERVSGQTLAEFLKTNLTAPLGMTDTNFYLPKDQRDRLVSVYSVEGNQLTKPTDMAASFWQAQGAYIEGPRKAFSGGAGLLSTAENYATFLQMLLNGGELDGKRYLSRKTVELMTSNHLRGVQFREGVGFGLGFSVVTDEGARGEPGSVGEFGWGGAYHSTYWVDPQEQLVVVHLTQVLPAGDLDDFGKVRAMVYQSIVN